MNKNNANADIRQMLIDKGIRHYEAAEACGVTLYTFSHWLQIEMKPEKKAEVLKNIEKYRVKNNDIEFLGKDGVQMVDMITEAEFYQQYREKTDRAAKKFCFARDRRKVVDVIQKRYPILNDYFRALLLENEMLLTVAKNGGFS